MAPIRRAVIRSTTLLVALITAAAVPAAPASAEPSGFGGPAGGAAPRTVVPQIVTTVHIGKRTVLVGGVRAAVPTVTVRGPSPRVAASINAMAAAVVTNGVTSFAARLQPGGSAWAEYWMSARVVANTSPVLSILFEDYANYGNAGLTR